MTEKSLRERIGILLILLHFGLLALIFIAFLNGGFRFNEFTTSVAIIAPMFTGYTTAIVVHFSRNRLRVRDTSPEVTTIFSVMSVAFPVAFFFAMSGCILLFATSRAFGDFQEFKGTITILESIFAAYMANFIYTLFEKQKTEDTENSITAGNLRPGVVTDSALSPKSPVPSSTDRE